jgi:methylmalonyl-CoA/ethylmalonyl-CoA epimerase
VTGVDHIGIAVERLDDALPFWRDLLGLEFGGIEEVPGEKVRVAFLRAGATRIELLEPTSPDSPIAKHLARRGPGIHHVALAVGDLVGRMAALERAGRPAMDDAPRPGAEGSKVTFIHPKSAGGVLVELVQPASGPRGTA